MDTKLSVDQGDQYPVMIPVQLGLESLLPPCMSHLPTPSILSTGKTETLGGDGGENWVCFEVRTTRQIGNM